jgi:hypothetical protein
MMNIKCAILCDLCLPFFTEDVENKKVNVHSALLGLLVEPEGVDLNSL